MKTAFHTVLLVLFGCCCLPVYGEISIDGFASLIAGQVMEDDRRLIGYSDEISLKPESRLGIQANTDFTDEISATVQVVSRGIDDFDLDLEWVYLTYQVNQQTRINTGRLRIPFYRYSDFIDIGFAYPWIRTPETIYKLNPQSTDTFTTYEGVGMIYDHRLGEWDSSLQIIFGNHDGTLDVVGTNDAKLDNLKGLNWMANYEWFSFRLGYFVTDISIDISNNQLFLQLGETLRSVGMQEAFKNLEIAKDNGRFFGAGFGIDYNSWFVKSEYTEVDVDDSLIAPQRQHYVSVGYHYQDLTFYSLFERREDRHNDQAFNQVPRTISLPSGEQMPFVDPDTGLFVQDIVNDFVRGNNFKWDINSYGIRYDFYPSMALKLDYSERKTTNQIGVQSKTTLLSFGLDVIF